MSVDALLRSLAEFDRLARAAEVHTGAMVALVPSDEDAARLAVPGGEPVGQLHLTLRYLGKSADFSPDARAHMVRLVRDYFRGFGPITGDLFSVAIFNPAGDEPAVVGLVGGDDIARAHNAVAAAVEDYGADLPEPRSPFVAHVTLEYTGDASRVADLVGRVGRVTFDRVRIAFGGEHVDIALGGASAVRKFDKNQLRDPHTGEWVGASIGHSLGKLDEMFGAHADEVDLADGRHVQAHDGGHVLLTKDVESGSADRKVLAHLSPEDARSLSEQIDKVVAIADDYNLEDDPDPTDYAADTSLSALPDGTYVNLDMDRAYPVQVMVGGKDEEAFDQADAEALSLALPDMADTAENAAADREEREADARAEQEEREAEAKERDAEAKAAAEAWWEDVEVTAGRNGLSMESPTEIVLMDTTFNGSANGYIPAADGPSLVAAIRQLHAHGGTLPPFEGDEPEPVEEAKISDLLSLSLLEDGDMLLTTDERRVTWDTVIWRDNAEELASQLDELLQRILVGPAYVSSRGHRDFDSHQPRDPHTGEWVGDGVPDLAVAKTNAGYTGPRYEPPPSVDARLAADLRERLRPALPESWSQGYATRQVDSEYQSDQVKKLIDQVGVPAARRIALEADAETALARLVQFQRPPDPTLGPYDDLPPVTNAEMDHIKAEATDQLRQDFAGKKVGVRVTAGSLEQILANGRFKTQFETRRSGGGYVPTKRKAAEETMFGLPADTDPKLRPIYGYLAMDGVQPTTPDGDLLNTYGEVQVILRESVRQRTTASVGDSLDWEVLPSPVDDPSWESFNGAAHSSGGMQLDYAGRRSGLYVEAQIHGGVGVHDFEEVVFPAKPSATMQASLADWGISWRVLES